MVISQKKSIQKKLLAATSMLLVACIMLISASYAWFTLSTAPEITGITTTVGANGNLEIALADKTTWNSPDSTVQQGVGTSGSNITWGNLVDLSDNATYGMNKIILMPSRLNMSGDATNGYTVNTASPILTPVYGVDGRISSLASNSMSAVFDGTSFPYATDAYGARAIGTATAMSARQNAYRSATSTLKTEMKAAENAASGTIYTYGADLASIIIGKVADDSATYKYEDIEFIDGMIDGLRTAQTEIYQALEGAIIGMAASKTNAAAVTDAQVSALAEFFNTYDYGTGYTINTSGIITVVEGVSAPEVALPSVSTDMLTYYNKLSEIGTKLDNAAEAKSNLSNRTDIVWSEFSTVMSYIVNPDAVLVNGSTKDELKDDMSKLVSAVQAGLEIQMPDNSGVYSEIAVFTGNYSAGITMKDVEVGTLGSISELNANMTTKVTGTSVLDNLQTAISAAGYPDNANLGADTVMTDTYAFAIDFYLRTNAANSKLLLQTTPAQRVYVNSDVEQTQGGGSSMTFSTSDLTNYPVDKVVDLMGAIRVVFLDGEGNVLTFAKLDMTEGNYQTTNGTTVKADLKLVSSFTATADTYGMKLTLGDFVNDTEDAVITSMPQNKAQKVTAMVYLDGDVVTNAMVANALTSMTGSMNLQFASSAELIPMNNTAYEEGTNFQN